MAIVFFIAFLLIGNSVTKTWIQSFDNAGIILGYLWTCLTMAIAVYAFIRRQRIEQWWFRRAQFSGTGEELVNIAKQVDAIVIPVSMHPTQPKWIMGLRVLVWVNLYLLEHTGKDFQPKIIFIS